MKDVVFDALLEVDPDARLPGRGRGRGGRDRGRDDGRGGRDRGRDDGRGRDRGRGRGREREQPAAASAADHLEAAEAALEEDPHKALELVDRAFKSRPDFDTWFGAYRARLAALVALNEREEALRTYERFRAKLYQRETLDRIETLLIDPAGPLADLLDDQSFRRELIDLYEVMPDRDAKFVEECVACAQACLESGTPDGVRCALAMLNEASARDEGAVAELLAEARTAAGEADIEIDVPDAGACKTSIAELDEEPHILLIGGDEGRRPHLARFNKLAADLGFEGFVDIHGRPTSAQDAGADRGHGARHERHLAASPHRAGDSGRGPQDGRGTRDFRCASRRGWAPMVWNWKSCGPCRTASQRTEPWTKQRSHPRTAPPKLVSRRMNRVCVRAAAIVGQPAARG